MFSPFNLTAYLTRTIGLIMIITEQCKCGLELKTVHSVHFRKLTLYTLNAVIDMIDGTVVD